MRFFAVVLATTACSIVFAGPAQRQAAGLGPLGKHNRGLPRGASQPSAIVLGTGVSVATWAPPTARTGPNTLPTLPILSTFPVDHIGGPPLTGGPSQPSEILSIPPGASILVRAVSTGVPTKAVELALNQNGDFASVGYEFIPVFSGTLHVEATLSIDHLFNGYALQTVVGPGAGSPVVTRVSFDEFGELYAGDVRIGTYEPNTPFRMRMVVDMSTKTWSTTVDHQLNGFYDDSTTSNLEFANDPAGIDYVGSVQASLNLGAGQGGNGPGRIVYDDVYVSSPENSCSTWSQSLTPPWVRWRPTHTPSPRMHLPIVYDAGWSGAVLFGGATSCQNRTPLADTWALYFVDRAVWVYDGTDWSLATGVPSDH